MMRYHIDFGVHFFHAHLSSPIKCIKKVRVHTHIIIMSDLKLLYDSVVGEDNINKLENLSEYSCGINLDTWTVENLYKRCTNTLDNCLVTLKFQRVHVWNSKHENVLIDSLLKSMSVGTIIVSRAKNAYSIIDGVQRITTILKYIREPEKFELYTRILKSQMKKREIHMAIIDMTRLSNAIREEWGYCAKKGHEDKRRYLMNEVIINAGKMTKSNVSELAIKLMDLVASVSQITNIRDRKINMAIYDGDEVITSDLFGRVNQMSVKINKYGIAAQKLSHGIPNDTEIDKNIRDYAIVVHKFMVSATENLELGEDDKNKFTYMDYLMGMQCYFEHTFTNPFGESKTYYFYDNPKCRNRPFKPIIDIISLIFIGGNDESSIIKMPNFIINQNCHELNLLFSKLHKCFEIADKVFRKYRGITLKYNAVAKWYLYYIALIFKKLDDKGVTDNFIAYIELHFMMLYIELCDRKFGVFGMNKIIYAAKILNKKFTQKSIIDEINSGSQWFNGNECKIPTRHEAMHALILFTSLSSELMEREYIFLENRLQPRIGSAPHHPAFDHNFPNRNEELIKLICNKYAHVLDY